MVSQFSLAFHLANAVKTLVKRVSERFEKEEVPINIHHHYLLNRLSLQTDINQSELAAMMERDKSAVLRHIDQLEEMKLVAREPDPNDRRKKHLVITSEGQDLLNHTRQLIFQTLDEMLQGVSQEDVQTFQNVLMHMQRSDLN